MATRDLPVTDVPSTIRSWMKLETYYKRRWPEKYPEIRHRLLTMVRERGIDAQLPEGHPLRQAVRDESG